MATSAGVEVVMPQMGVSVSEGTITKRLKGVGEPVEPTGRGGRGTKKDKRGEQRAGGAPDGAGARRAATRPGTGAGARGRSTAGRARARRVDRADERDAARDRRAHAPLARHGRAR